MIRLLSKYLLFVSSDVLKLNCSVLSFEKTAKFETETDFVASSVTVPNFPCKLFVNIHRDEIRTTTTSQKNSGHIFQNSQLPLKN